MFCPTCGADVPDSTFCPNCGSVVSSGITQGAPAGPMAEAEGPGLGGDGTLAASPSDGASFSRSGPFYQGESAQGGGRDQHASQMPYSTQLPPSGSAYYVEKAPQAAFVLTIIGLALAILGFSVITIIPGILCCIIGLALNAHYENEEMINPRKTPTLVIGVIGIIVSIVAAVFFVGFGMLSAQFIQEPDGGGDRGAIVESKSSSSSAGESASAKTSSSLRIDPKAFDDKGNVTLYALFELTGEALQEELEARGYKWIENAHAWMASGGAAFEVQNNEGIMSRDDIDRLEEGAIFTSVAYAVTIVGYDTPAAALEGLSEAVVVEDTCADFEGGIVFALVYGSDKEEHLAAISDVGDKQQTILVFSQDAVEEGLFSEITGVSSGKSIDKIWKALNGK